MASARWTSWKVLDRVALPDLLGITTSTGLSRRTRTLLRRDKERYVRGLTEDFEFYLNANYLRSAYQALKKLCSKSTSVYFGLLLSEQQMIA